MKRLKQVIETAFPSENVELKRNADYQQVIELAGSYYQITKHENGYFAEKWFIGQLVPIGYCFTADIIRLIEIEQNFNK